MTFIARLSTARLEPGEFETKHKDHHDNTLTVEHRLLPMAPQLSSSTLSLDVLSHFSALTGKQNRIHTCRAKNNCLRLLRDRLTGVDLVPGIVATPQLQCSITVMILCNIYVYCFKPFTKSQLVQRSVYGTFTILSPTRCQGVSC